MAIAAWNLLIPLRLKKTSKPKPNISTQANELGKYSSIAFKMLAVICLGVFGGYQLDIFFKTKPIFIVIFSLGSVALAIYSTIRDFLKEK